MKIQWHEVTWYSKWGTVLVVIIVLPILTFYIGQSYEKLKEIQKLANETDITAPTDNGHTVSTSTDSAQTSAIDTTNWKEYSSDELGFGIKYPPELTIQPDQNQTSVTFVFPDSLFSTVLKDDVAVSVYAEPTCMPIFYTNTGNNGSMGTFSVNGIDFIRSEQLEGAMGHRYDVTAYDVIRNKVCYRTTFSVQGTNGAGFYENDPAKIKSIDETHDRELARVRDIFSAMLSSFHFIDTPEGINEADAVPPGMGSDVLTSATPSTIAVGDTLTLLGKELSGHDVLVWIYANADDVKLFESFSGKYVLWGGMPTSDTKISFKMPTKVCTQYTGASGLPCPWYGTLKAGKYFIYVDNQNGHSNLLPITIK